MRIISFEVATCELPQPTPALVIKQPEIRFPSGKMRFFNAAQTYGELVIIPLDLKECQRLKNDFLPFKLTRVVKTMVRRTERFGFRPCIKTSIAIAGTINLRPSGPNP
jgi:hypothetical protein